mmetsp:Transcript_8515/g.34840  ORF Transcript_8515/g.34840 Transcript_8515/m.34840 type:complete len:287 (-) Transcript_8515:27-887(-)
MGRSLRREPRFALPLRLLPRRLPYDVQVALKFFLERYLLPGALRDLVGLRLCGDCLSEALHPLHLLPARNFRGPFGQSRLRIPGVHLVQPDGDLRLQQHVLRLLEQRAHSVHVSAQFPNRVRDVGEGAGFALELRPGRATTLQSSPDVLSERICGLHARQVMRVRRVVSIQGDLAGVDESRDAAACPRLLGVDPEHGVDLLRPISEGVRRGGPRVGGGCGSHRGSDGFRARLHRPGLTAEEAREATQAEAADILRPADGFVPGRVTGTSAPVRHRLACLRPVAPRP